MLALAWRRLRQWPALERFLSLIAGHFTTWPADDFGRFTRTPLSRSRFQTGEPEPASTVGADLRSGPVSPPRTFLSQSWPEPALAPSAFEQRFARLQREGRFDDMWPMLADDAQRSWGGPAAFAERMRDQTGNLQVVDTDVQDVDFISEWTDRRAGRTYRNVARLDVSYRVKHGQREWALRRQVHLVPAGDGWRTLCYPQAD